MKIGMTLDWWMEATSLLNLAKNMFRELGLLMNAEKTFTISGIKTNTIGIGDINQHFDLIHIPNMGGYRFPPPSIFSAKKIIVSLSGIDEIILGREVFKTDSDWKHYKPIIDKEVEKWKKYSSKLSAVHVVTQAEKNDMVKCLDIPEELFHIIPHGVDHDVFKPANDKMKTRKEILSKFFLLDKPYFIHLSESNWARKNILRLLESFRLAKENGLPHILIIVGKNDRMIFQTVQRIPDVFVLGFVNQNHLVELLQGADAMIMPSIHEGFGLPLLEAMACGVPSVTLDKFSPPEVVGDSGILVDPYDTEKISYEILRIGKNENLRMDLSKKALERSKMFSWKNNAKELIKLYKQIIPTSDFSFEEDYDKAAYRTLVTVCEITPGLRDTAAQDLLKFDFKRIIMWALEVGLKDPDVKDFLIPFKSWLVEKSEE